MADEVLIQSAKSGDRKAFTELVVRHQSSLLRLCMRFTNSQDLAEDIVQDTFVKAFMKLSTFEGRSTFKSWLFQIAINTAKNKLRSQRDMLSLDQIQVSIKATSASDGIEKENVRDILRDFVDKLPEKQKMALTLRIYDDLSFKEIADIMECPYDTAKANYRHGLMNIKKALEKKNMIDHVVQSAEEAESTWFDTAQFQNVEI